MIEEKLEEIAHVVTTRELKVQAEYERKCPLADRGIGHWPWRAPLIPKFDFAPVGELALKLDQNYAAEGIRWTFADGKKQRLDI